MQTNRINGRSALGLLFFVVAILTIADLSSCTNNKKNSETSCFYLTRTELNPWFPASAPVANQVVAIHFFPTINGNNYQITARAFNSAGNQVGNDLTLNPGDGCVLPEPLPVIAQYYQVMVSALNILNPDNTLLTDLDQLNFTPVNYAWQSVNYLELQVDARIRGVNEDRAPILPCPPCENCRPPCPSNCEPACDNLQPSQDSLSAQRDTVP